MALLIFLTVTFQVNIPAPASWLTAVENKGCGVIKERKVRDTMQGLSTCTLSPNQVEVKESVAELIATGLRRRDGIALAAWQEVSLIYIQNTWEVNFNLFLLQGMRWGVEC